MKRNLLSATALSAFLLAGGAFAQTDGTSGTTTEIPPPVSGQTSGDAGQGGAATGGAEAGGTAVQGETSAPAAGAEAGTTGDAGSAGAAEAGGADAAAGSEAGAAGAAGGETGDAGATSGTAADGDAAAGADGDAAAGADADAAAGADGDAAAAAANSESNATTNVEVTQEQRTVIRNTIINNNDVERVDVDFDISIGVSVPRTYTFYDLPPQIIEIVPAYRTYRYFVLVDGTICIVDPNTYVIVYVIEA